MSDIHSQIQTDIGTLQIPSGHSLHLVQVVPVLEQLQVHITMPGLVFHRVSTCTHLQVDQIAINLPFPTQVCWIIWGSEKCPLLERTQGLHKWICSPQSIFSSKGELNLFFEVLKFLLEIETLLWHWHSTQGCSFAILLNPSEPPSISGVVHWDPDAPS